MEIGTITDSHIKAITRNLRASYGAGITEDLVNAEIDKLKQGEQPTNIIGMFTKGMLEDAGLITGG